MKRKAGWALFLLAAALFWLANRGAYKGYFQDDELDNLSWAPAVPAGDFARLLVTPRYLSGNFRPVGHLYFAVLGPRLGLDFPKYLIPIHALHLLNVWLVWMLARRLGASPFAAGAGALFFAFHMAVFDVYWKPMYVFDLLCATFSLLCLLFYLNGRWLLSFVAFWLAYKSKELAVMLPAVLAACEFLMGKRRWKPLAPFFVVSLSFGLQALLLNRREESAYSFRFTPAAMAQTSVFYAGRLLLIPFAGFLAPLLLLVRDHRVRLGTAAMLLFLFPLACLPGRMFGAYCYVPLIGAAAAVSGLAMRLPKAMTVAFFLIWLPWNEFHLKQDRKQALAVADEHRSYVAGLIDLERAAPETRTFVYDSRPSQLSSWGILGALRMIFHRNHIQLASIEDPASRAAVQSASVAILNWDPARRKLVVTRRDPHTPDAAYIQLNPTAPLWQLTEGWYSIEHHFAWIQPRATARLRRPVGARQFEVQVVVGEQLIRETHRTILRAYLDGRLLGERVFTAPSFEVLRWELPRGEPGAAQVEFRAEPPYRTAGAYARTLGIAIAGFGFLPREQP